MDNVPKENHRLEMTQRNELKVYGVIDVHSFNDEGVLLQTNQGILLVGGSNLRITKLNLEQSEVALKGEIDNLTYSDAALQSEKGGGFLSRLFK